MQPTHSATRRPAPHPAAWGLRAALLVLLVVACSSLYARALGPQIQDPQTDGRLATALKLTQIASQPDGALQFQATVTATDGGTPTGTVELVEGDLSLGSTALEQGIAVFSVAPSALSPTAVVSALYDGDESYLPSVSGNLPVAGGTAGAGGSGTGLALAALSTAAPTIAPGGSASFPFSVTVVGGSAFTSPVTFSVSGQQQDAVASFSPASLAAGSGSQTVTLTVQTPPASATASTTTTARGPSSGSYTPGVAQGIGSLGLAFILLPFAARARRLSRSYGALLLCMVILAGCGMLTGCGVTVAPTTEQPQTYTLSVTAASGSAVQTVKCTLIVNPASSQ